MTSNGSNGSFSYLMDQLDARLERIERAIDRLADEHKATHQRVEGRITLLEQYKAEAQGGWKALTIAASIGAAIAGSAGAYVSRFFG